MFDAVLCSYAPELWSLKRAKWALRSKLRRRAEGSKHPEVRPVPKPKGIRVGRLKSTLVEAASTQSALKRRRNRGGAGSRVRRTARRAAEWLNKPVFGPAPRPAADPIEPPKLKKKKGLKGHMLPRVELPDVTSSVLPTPPPKPVRTAGSRATFLSDPELQLNAAQEINRDGIQESIDPVAFKRKKKAARFGGGLSFDLDETEPEPIKRKARASGSSTVDLKFEKPTRLELTTEGAADRTCQCGRSIPGHARFSSGHLRTVCFDCALKV